MKPPRWVVLAVFCQCVQVFMSFDGGATPASLDNILQTSGIEWTEARECQVELGLLGSLDKLGMTISSVLWGRVLQLFPAKVLLIFGLGLNALMTFAFGNFKLKSVMFSAKFMMGVTQGLQCVWSTCWVLSHAPVDCRTVWISLGAISAGVGSGLGTAVAGFGTDYGMPYAFAWQVEAGLLALLWLALVLCPEESLSLDSFDADAEVTEDFILEVEKAHHFSLPRSPRVAGVRRSRTSSALEEVLDDIVFHAHRNTSGCLREDSRAGDSVSSRREQVLHVSQHFDEVAIRRARTASHMHNEAPLVVESDALEQVFKLVKNRIYIRTTLTLASIMFVTSGVQFLWVRCFMAVWGVGKGFAVTGFLLSTGLGGAVGVVFGPQAIDRCGGFMSSAGRTKSLRLIARLFSVSLAGAALAIGAVLIKFGRGMPEGMPEATRSLPPRDGALLYVVWLAVFVVFAGFNGGLAGLTGINVASAGAEMRSVGSGFTVSIQNLLGYAMGPLLPGAVMDRVSGAFPATDPGRQAELLCCGLLTVLLGVAVATGLSFAALAASRHESRRDVIEEERPLLGD